MVGNPLVALSVQHPSIADAVAQGEELKTARLGNLLQQQKLQEAQQAAARENQLRQLYQTIGPGLVSGDPNALSQLAGVDPMKALDVQGVQQGQQKTRGELADADRKRGMDQLEFVGRNAPMILNAPPEMQGILYARGIAQAKALGMDTSRAPPQWGPEAKAYVEQTQAQAISVKDQLEQRDKEATAAEQKRQFGVTSGETALRDAEAARNNAAGRSIQERTLTETIRKNKAAETVAEDAALDDKTTELMANQYLAGDKSVLTNLGRGKQGPANIVKLRGKIAQSAAERGWSGRDIANSIAEFSGLTAGERTLGNRTANIGMAVNEAKQMAPLALAASDKVSRTNFPSLNSVILAGERGTGDENAVRLGIATNSLINIYARAISPTGVPTVSDKDHARELLSAAWSKGQYRAGVDQLLLEMNAASQAPGMVREEFRRGTERGQTSNTLPTPMAAPSATPNNSGWSVQKVSP